MVLYMAVFKHTLYTAVLTLQFVEEDGILLCSHHSNYSY